MPKLTKRFIDTLRPGAGSDLFAWDSELKGFGVRMKPSGTASYLIQYRTPQGRTRRYAFARVGTLTPEEARARARRLLASVAAGSDPSAQRHEARRALTVAQLCEQYMGQARLGLVVTRARKPKRASTTAIDEGRVSRHIIPLIGRRVANDLRRADVQRMADAIAAGKTATTARVTGGPGTAARVVGRGLVSRPNPARGVETQQGEAKDRVLSKDELASLGEALRRHEEHAPMACWALRLSALTCLRRQEAVGLRLREIDLDGSCLRLGETKTGRSTRPIGKAAVEHLRALPMLHGEWLFPNRGGTGSADLKRPIAAIFDAAGLRDARSRDLRRTFASVAAELGYGDAAIAELLGHARRRPRPALPAAQGRPLVSSAFFDAAIAELLGHARRGVTERHYVRRPDAVLVAAASRTAAIIRVALDGQKDELRETAC
jgi:integrase